MRLRRLSLDEPESLLDGDWGFQLAHYDQRWIPFVSAVPGLLSSESECRLAPAGLAEQRILEGIGLVAVGT